MATPGGPLVRVGPLWVRPFYVAVGVVALVAGLVVAAIGGGPGECVYAVVGAAIGLAAALRFYGFADRTRTDAALRSWAVALVVLVVGAAIGIRVFSGSAGAAWTLAFLGGALLAPAYTTRRPPPSATPAA